MKKHLEKLIFLIFLISGVVHAACKSQERPYEETRKEQLNEIEKYLDRDKPEGIRFGISSLESRDGYFYITLGSEATLLQYQTNREKVSKVKITPSVGVGTKLIGVALSPLFLLFNPKGWVDEMGGCTEEISSVTRLNTENQTPTGEKIIVSDYFPYKDITFIFSSNGESFKSTVGLRDKAVTYYLGTFGNAYGEKGFVDFIKKNQNKGLVELSVTCSECEDSLPKDNQSLSFYKTINQSVDFSPIFKGYSDYLSVRKKQAYDDQKIKQEEENLRVAAKQKQERDMIKAQEDKQKNIERANQAKADAIAKSQAAEQKILDQYKEKCSNLGFKVGTDAFGKCVLQLTK
jgi:hypothetical protein